MRVPGVSIAAAFSFIFLFIAPGCTGKPGSGDANASSKTLVAAAQDTYVRFLKTREGGVIPSGQEIPASCWAGGIRALHPIRVYLHRVNVVVVQKATGSVEQGKYIYIPISSYLPQSGDDGFTFANPNGPVWDFTRSAGN
jgi:hypothetical protein